MLRCVEVLVLSAAFCGSLDVSSATSLLHVRKVMLYTSITRYMVEMLTNSNSVVALTLNTAEVICASLPK
jgi:kynureninase